MNWIKVSVFTTGKGIDSVVGRLLNLGIESTQVEDEQEFNEFLEDNRGSWDYVDDDLVKEMSKETKVSFYLDDEKPDIIAMVREDMQILKSMDTEDEFGRLEVDAVSLGDTDWQNNWKNYFHTFEIGDKLIIKPYWEEAENKDGKTVFEINPGLSFGTGTHNTTKMCLEDVIDTVHTDDEVLDLGCGSGILSIVSLQFGAKSAIAVDIDENSLKTAYENLERNSIDRDKYEVVIGNIITDEGLQKKIMEKKYDVILANIVADVIIAILPFVKKALKENGTFITSGIIDYRTNEVRDAIVSHGFNIISEKRSADWAEFKCRIAK